MYVINILRVAEELLLGEVSRCLREFEEKNIVGLTVTISDLANQ